MTQEACPRCGAPRAAATPFCTNCGTPFSTPEAMPPGDAPTMVAGGQPSGSGSSWGSPAGDQPGIPPQQAGPGQWGPPQAGGPQHAGQWGPPQGPGGPGGPGQWGPGPQPGGGNRGKIVLIIGLLLLVLIGGGIAAALVLGGDDDDEKSGGKKGGTSEPISTEEFCASWAEIEELDGDDQEALDRGKTHLAELEKRGTPADMPDDAREGFEVFLKLVEEVDTPDQATEQTNQLSEEEQRRMQSFFMYLSENCESSIDVPSVTAPTDLPTDLFSETPTDFPTDFDPSDFGLDEDDLKELEELESMLAELSEYASPQ